MLPPHPPFKIGSHSSPSLSHTHSNPASASLMLGLQCVPTCPALDTELPGDIFLSNDPLPLASMISMKNILSFKLSHVWVVSTSCHLSYGQFEDGVSRWVFVWDRVSLRSLIWPQTQMLLPQFPQCWITAVQCIPLDLSYMEFIQLDSFSFISFIRLGVSSHCSSHLLKPSLFVFPFFHATGLRNSALSSSLLLFRLVILLHLHSAIDSIQLLKCSLALLPWLTWKLLV